MRDKLGCMRLKLPAGVSVACVGKQMKNGLSTYADKLRREAAVNRRDMWKTLGVSLKSTGFMNRRLEVSASQNSIQEHRASSQVWTPLLMVGAIGCTITT